MSILIGSRREMGGGSRPSSSAKTLRDVGLSNVACWTSSRKRGNYQVRVWVDGGSKLIMYYEHDNWDGPLAGSLTCFKTEAKALRVYEHLRVDGDEQKIITFTKDPKQLDDYKVVMLDGLSGKIECVICKTAVNKASPEARDYLPDIDGSVFFCPECQDKEDFKERCRELEVIVIIHEESDSEDSEPYGRDVTDDYKATIVVDDKGYASDEFDEGVPDS